MNFLRKRSQIPPPPGEDHGRVRSIRAASVWSAVFPTKFKMADEADSSVSGEVILGKHKLVSIKDKFYMLLATLESNCMRIGLEVLTTATTILLAHTGQFLQDL